MEFPDCWEEVQTLEWTYLLGLHAVLMHNSHRVYLESLLRAWTLYVLERRGYKTNGGVDDMLLVDRLSQTLTWMYRINQQGEIELTCETTVNLLPKYRQLVGPASHGADLTFGEFRHAVTVMNAYTTDHDPASLLALCAILYRLPFKDRDGSMRRGRFREYRFAKFIQDAEQIPPALRYGIYVQFAYFCQYLQTGSFVIDGAEVTFAPLFAKSTGEQMSGVQDLGLTGILLSVAESGVFGNVGDTDDAPLLQVMLKMLADKQKADLLLKNLKQKSK